MDEIQGQPEVASVTAPPPDQIPLEQSTVADQVSPQQVPQLAGPAPVQPGQPPQAPPPGQQAAPANVVPAHAPHHGDIFRSIFSTLAGEPRTQYAVDPQTGTMQATQSAPQTKGQLAKSILAGALTGLISGASQSSGAGARAFGTSAQAATQQRQQQDQQARQQASEDYKQGQEQKLRQAQIMRLNMQTLHDATEIQDHDDKEMDQHVAQYADLLSQVPQTDIMDQHVPADQMMKKGYNGTKVATLPDGRAEILDKDGRPTHTSQLTFTVYDPTSSSPLAKTIDVQKAHDWGIAPFAKMSPDQLKTLSDPDGTAMTTNIVAQGITQQIATREIMLKEMNRIQSVVAPNGTPITAQDLQQRIASDSDPNALVSAMQKYQRTAGAANTPWARIEVLSQADPKAAAEIRNLIGPENFEAYKEKQAAQAAGDKSAAEAQGKLGVEGSAPAIAAKVATKIAEENAAANTPEGRLKNQKERLEIEQLQKKLAGPDLTKIQSAIPADADGNAIRLTPTDNYPINTGALEQIRTDNPGLAATIEALGQYRMQLTPQAARTKDGQALLEATNLVYPRYNQPKSENYFKLRQDKQMAAQLNILSTAMQHLGTYYDNINPVSGTIGTGAVARALGNKSAKVVQEARGAASDEFGKLYKGGAATDQEKTSWENNLGGTTWLEQKNGAVGAADLLAGKIDSYVTQLRNAAPPGMRDDTLQIFSPQAAAAYKTITGKDLTSSAQPFMQGPNPPITGGAGGTKPIYITAPGKPRLMSNDGGKTWIPAPTPQAQ